MRIKTKIFVAGHGGFLGKAILKKFNKKNIHLLVEDKKNLNLTSRDEVYKYLKQK